MALSAGSLIGDRYKILSLLGEGGFATVYQALDLSLNRELALKIIKHVGSLSDNDLARIKQESKILSKLSHPNIVGIYAIEFLEDGTPLLAMEYLPGKSLHRLLLNHPHGLAQELCKEVFIQICRGLAHAHQYGVIHRDLSAANVILLQEERDLTVKLIDFGLSKLRSTETGTSLALTQTGCLVGNPSYMSPEACRGEKPNEKSDIYSLGCLLYEMLCGNSMFEGLEPIALLYKQQHEYPMKPDLNWPDKEFQDQVTDMLLACIQKDPDKRPESIQEILDILIDSPGKIIDPRKLETWKSSSQSGKITQTRKTAIAIILTILLAFGLSTVYILTRKKTEPSPLRVEAKKIDPVISRLLKTLELKESRYGSNHRVLIKPLSELCQYYGTNNMLKEAIPYLERLSKLTKENPGFDKERESCLWLLSVAYQTSNPQLTANLLSEQLEIIERNRGKSNSDYMASLQHLAQAYARLHQSEKAEYYFKSAVKLGKNSVKDVDLLLQSQVALAQHYMASLKHKEAIEEFNEAIGLFEEVRKREATPTSKYQLVPLGNSFADKIYMDARLGLSREFQLTNAFEKQKESAQKGLEFLKNDEKLTETTKRDYSSRFNAFIIDAGKNLASGESAKTAR